MYYLIKLQYESLQIQDLLNALNACFGLLGFGPHKVKINLLYHKLLEMCDECPGSLCHSPSVGIHVGA